MNKIKVKHVNIITLFFVSTFNLIFGIINNWNYDKYIFFVAPFVIALIVCIFIKSYNLDALLFFVITQLCILIGEWGNLSAALFLCYAIYCFNNTIITIMIICLTVLTIVLKFMFLLNNSTVIEGLLYCIGMAYALSIYYLIIHPKIKIFIEENDINKKILKLLIQGYRPKEIADIINLTYNAVAKRLEKMREKYNCENNVQMICSFMKTGQLRLK